MSRTAILTFTLIAALSSSAGTIVYESLETYDTGIRLLNGRWKIGAQVEMSYLNAFGNPAEGTWEAQLWINNVHNGASLASTGAQFFSSMRWKASIEAYANYDSCYQGKAYAKAGGDVKEVGGNHVCTDPRPLSDPPTCPPGSTAADCSTPIVLSLRGGYHMTSPADGVLFDIDADGTAEEVAWTEPKSNVGFLALDRNGNGMIESGAELFGGSTLLRNGARALNGFDALDDLDSNRDGVIDASDPSWQSLLIWLDANHDGISTATEMITMPTSGVRAISTDYQRSGKKDRFGNEFRYKGEFQLGEAKRPCYDVFLVTAN